MSSLTIFVPSFCFQANAKLLTNPSKRAGQCYHTEVVIPNVAKSTAEGPLWLKESKTLLFVDALDGDVIQWDSVNGQLSTVHFGTYI